MTDLTPEELAALDAAANDPETGVAAQQADFAASQQPSGAPPPPCDTSDAGIRSRGGYMLMDPQWVAGGPWNGIPAAEMQGEQNRRHDVVQQMKAGTAFGFTHDAGTNPADELDPFATDIAGYFPASKAGRTNLQTRTGDDRVEYAIQVGNELVACLADPNFYVFE